jgi:hypothetical protein
MHRRPVTFAPPDGELTPLKVAPRLDSWMRAGHPDQNRLEAFLTHAVDVLAPKLTHVPDPLALRLDVGLPPAVALLDAYDLDNYVFRLAMRLSKDTGRQFACVWATKRHAKSSLIGVQQAVHRDGSVTTGEWVHVHTTASSATGAYKKQVNDAVRGEMALPGGPVALELSFTVGPSRNWPNLWKPTIDALGPLLGEVSSKRPWNPRDGRIVELGLHRHIEPNLGNDVLIAIAARPHP